MSRQRPAQNRALQREAERHARAQSKQALNAETKPNRQRKATKPQTVRGVVVSALRKPKPTSR